MILKFPYIYYYVCGSRVLDGNDTAAVFYNKCRFRVDSVCVRYNITQFCVSRSTFRIIIIKKN